jgi:hypothetical protein
MATGDASDMRERLKAVLPVSWFPDQTPVLDGLLSGVASGYAVIYALLGNVIQQARISTATGVFLDLIALDFFGNGLLRTLGQNDRNYLAAIRSRLLAPAGTRAALAKSVTDLTGREPVIFEPTRPADTGSYNDGGAAYGVVGGYGSLDLPFQCFVTAFLPIGNGLALVDGYGGGAGGYGAGVIEYATAAEVTANVSDADIAAAVARVMPVATIAWLKISN